MNAVYKKSVFINAAKVAHLTYQIGESDLLRKKSMPLNIKKISSLKTRSLVTKLKTTLLEYKKLTGKGRGIAAVQIGVPIKIAVLFIGNDLETIINPKVIKKSSKLLTYPEICMSANPVIARVIRPSWIEVEYFDEKGVKKTWKRKDKTRQNLVLNRVIQHEIDHLEGIINIDLVKPGELILDSDPNYFKQAEFVTHKETGP